MNKDESQEPVSAEEITKARALIGRVNQKIWMEKTTHAWRVANCKRARRACKRHPVKVGKVATE